MINLLPENIQKALHADYWHRVYIIVFFFVASALLVLLLFLGLIYFVLSQENTNARAAITANNGSTKEELLAELKTSSDELALFSAKDNGYIPTVLLNELISGSATSIGVYLTEFSYKATKKDSTVILSGSARTRDALVRFLGHLRGKKIVELVESPISSLSKSVDIPFSVTVHLITYAGEE